jgi:hypothetical protein
MSPTQRRRRPLRLHWAVALMPPPLPQVETGRRTRHHRCPPRLPRSFFLHDFAPPPAIVRPWPCQRRRCGMPAVIRFDVFIVVVVVVVVIPGLDILCCGHRHLSRCATASLVALPPLSSRQCLSHCASLAPAVGCCIITSLAAPVPLLSCRRLSRRAGASLLALPPLSLRRGLSCGASPALAGCCFANYLDVLPSLLLRRLVVALLPLSLRRCLSLHHLSHCAAVSLSHRPSQPQ